MQKILILGVTRYVIEYCTNVLEMSGIECYNQVKVGYNKNQVRGVITPRNPFYSVHESAYAAFCEPNELDEVKAYIRHCGGIDITKELSQKVDAGFKIHPFLGNAEPLLIGRHLFTGMPYLFDMLIKRQILDSDPLKSCVELAKIAINNHIDEYAKKLLQQSKLRKIKPISHYVEIDGNKLTEMTTHLKENYTR